MGIGRAVLCMVAALCVPMTVSAEPRPLFNGQDLDGWEHVGFGRFTVEEGLLTTDGGVGLLWFAGEKLGDATLRVVYRADSETSNSGVFIRIPRVPTDTDMAVNEGHEIQINNAGKTTFERTGAIYTMGEAQSQPAIVGEWNVMEITMDGPRTVVHINDELVADYTEGDPVPLKKTEWDPDRGQRPDSGYIGLQNHPQGSGIQFREVSIEPLEN